MDETLRHHNPNPIASANIISRTFFWWLNPILKTGYGRPLQDEDMFNTVQEDASGYLGDKLESEWGKEVEAGRVRGVPPSLLRVLIRCFGIQYMLAGLLAFIEEAPKLIQPLMLAGLIEFFTPGSKVSTTEAYLYALGVSLCAFVTAISTHPFLFMVSRIGMQMRVGCSSMVYRKALRLSNKAFSETTIGQIVNIVSNDVGMFDYGMMFLHFLWIGPVQAVTVLVILWYDLGSPALAGFSVLVLLIPLQVWIGALFSKFRQKAAVSTDERVRVMNEIISGMRVIKMYCWEKPFADLVERIRRTQLKHTYHCMCVEAVREFLWVLGDKILMMTVILPYLLTTPYPRTRDVFLLLAFINPVQKLWLGIMVEACKLYGSCHVSVKRITEFLCLDTMQENNQLKMIDKDEGNHQGHVHIHNVTASWNRAPDQCVLKNVTASVRTGELLAVIGPVGSGKSSLLMSVLGELPTSEGQIEVKGKIAYVSQEPWVFSASLRQNITMGRPFYPDFYNKVIHACALSKDLKAMPHADTTMIGDRGVTLSGGQRARVSLARAVYMDADIYLLDDPLSAVDAAVGRHIFDKCIQGVLRSKPRILVTHQVQYLKEADHILILKDGGVIGEGSYGELATSGIDFASLLNQSKDMEQKEITDETDNFGSSSSLSSLPSDKLTDARQEEDEGMEEGTVGMGVYVEYFRAGGGVILFLLLVLLNLLVQTSYVLGDWWISLWADAEEHKFQLTHDNSTNTTSFSHNDRLNALVFSGSVLGVLLFGLLRALVFFRIAISSSQKLHNFMFASVLRTSITFFDKIPIGRVLNRFAKDIGSMDDFLPTTFFECMQCLMLIFGFIVVAGVINPWVFIPTLPLCILFVLIRRYYLRTSRSIKRLEGTTRSPVFSHLSASLQGLHTIRASRLGGRFMSEFDAHQDLHTEAWFLSMATSRWLGIRLDVLCAMFVTVVTFCSIPVSESLDAGLVGLSVIYAMTLLGFVQLGVRQSAEVENQMVSVERVLEYSRLPSEAPLESKPEDKPPNKWPKHGIITGEKVSLKYSQTGPVVLKDINFCIRAHEKVGIVGRTGAGKSSLIAMLFRMVEPTGKVMIDGVNIQHIGLHDLRRTISIIPQDPVLFTGPLRTNLDPFGEQDDDKLWKALEEVQLKKVVEELPGQLETVVSEGGVNFSVGQRQLICLARAVLRNNRILIIDEATANVDHQTDELIQETIREKFRTCTVLTIAHRLNTIMDSDRVMVLDAGKITDFDEPHILLEKGEGHFYDMVQQTADSEHLAAVALSTYRARHLNTDHQHINSTQVSKECDKSIAPELKIMRGGKELSQSGVHVAEDKDQDVNEAKDDSQETSEHSADSQTHLDQT